MTEEEFVRGCLEDEELVRALSDRSSDPPMVVQISADSTPRYQLNQTTHNTPGLLCLGGHVANTDHQTTFY